MTGAYVVEEVGDTVEGNLALDDHGDEHEDLSHALAENIEYFD